MKTEPSSVDRARELNRLRQRRYYWSNRELVLARKGLWYSENAEELKARRVLGVRKKDGLPNQRSVADHAT